MELDFSQPGSGDQEKVVSGTSPEETVDVTSPPVPPPAGGPTLDIPSDQLTDTPTQESVAPPTPPQDAGAVPIAPQTVPQPPTEFPAHPPQKAKGHAGLWITIIILIIVLGGGAYYFLMTDSGKSLIGLTPTEPTSTDFDPETSTTFEPTLPETQLNTGTATTQTPSTADATPASRDTQRKSDLSKLQTAIDLYRTENGSYPLSSTIIQAGDATTTVYSALVPKFLATVPSDPLAIDQGYWYGYRSDTGATAYLTARLEETTDPSATLEDGKYIYHVPLTGVSSASQTTTTTQSTLTPTTSTLPSTSTPSTTTMVTTP